MDNIGHEEGKWEYHPVTAERWADLVSLFSENGNPNYCWCMLWRLPSKAYRTLNPAGRRSGLETMVQNGTPVGVLAYLDGRPVGWCSIAPRESYNRLERSTTLKRLDDRPVWSVVCFFVDPVARGKGLSSKLLRAAIDYAVDQGAEIIEGYPVEPGSSYQYMGVPSTFKKAGFQVAGVAGNGRLIMRLEVGEEAVSS